MQRGKGDAECRRERGRVYAIAIQRFGEALADAAHCKSPGQILDRADLPRTVQQAQVQAASPRPLLLPGGGQGILADLQAEAGAEEELRIQLLGKRRVQRAERADMQRRQLGAEVMRTEPPHPDAGRDGGGGVDHAAEALFAALGRRQGDVAEVEADALVGAGQRRVDDVGDGHPDRRNRTPARQHGGSVQRQQIAAARHVLGAGERRHRGQDGDTAPAPHVAAVGRGQ